MHRLLQRQVARATRPSGELDLDALLSFIDAAYREADVDRDRMDRAMLLTCEEMEQLNAELLALAHHDALTGLPNRLAFAVSATTAVARARQGEGLAVLLVDLDRFKAVNDTLGHAMGDALLCEVAARLRAAVRHGDTVARMGGDEFAIIQIGFDLLDGAEDLARRVVHHLSAPYTIRGVELAVGACVGVAFASRSNLDAIDVDLLLGKADRALYRAKREGRCTWRTYEPDVLVPNERGERSGVHGPGAVTDYECPGTLIGGTRSVEQAQAGSRKS